MTTPSLSILPSLSTFKKGHSQTLDILVALQAPERKTTVKRPSLNLAIVIDNSGSMSGGPLEHAKQAARALVGSLKEEDRVSIVTYSDQAKVVLESMSAEAAKKIIDSALNKVRPEGLTALEAGWLVGAQQIAPFVSSYGVSRVLLLSDGEANVGQTNIQKLAETGLQLADKGITTSTYGIGNNFNETLMTAIAQSSQGVAVYASNADDLATYFSNEFAMLCDLAGKDISLGLTVKHQTKGKLAIPVKCLNTLPLNSDGTVRLPALLSGAESWAIYTVELDEKTSLDNITIEGVVTYLDDQGEKHSLKKSTEVKAGAKNGKNNTKTVERAKEVRAGILAKEAAEAARRGDMETTNNILRGISGMAGNNAYVSAVAHNLSALAATGNLDVLAKEAHYSSTTMSTRAVEANENFLELNGGKYGLRKAEQGKAQKGEEV